MTLIFNIHYFLWYGALTSIFGYEMVYARQYTNATTIQFGYLNMVLPFVTVITTPFICSMADRRRNHRSFFTLALVFATLSLCLYALLPILLGSPSYNNHVQRQVVGLRAGQRRSQEGGLHVWPFVYFCLTSLICDLSMGVANCLSDSFAVLQAEEKGTSFGTIMVWGTFGWAGSALALCYINQWSLLPRLLPGILYGTILLALDVLIVSFWPQNADFKLDLIPTSAAQALTGSMPSSHKDPSDYMPMNESARINVGIEVDKQDGRRRRRMKSPLELCQEGSSSLSGSSRRRNTWRILKRISSHHKHTPVSSLSLEKRKTLDKLDSEIEEVPTSTMSSVVIKTIDSSGFNAAQASTGSAISAELGKVEISPPVTPPAESARDLPSSASEKTREDSMTTLAESKRRLEEVPPSESEKQEPVEGVKKEISAEPEAFSTSFKMQIMLLCIIMQKRRSIVRFFLLFIMAGFFMSMHWNYFFLYLEEIYLPKFELISALSMVSQSLIGELPFFILSRKLIDLFGRSHTISISIISIGVRFLLYVFLLPNVNMYCIFLADCFQGPNYGLFYVVMTEVGLEYSFCDDDTIERLAKTGQIDNKNRLQVDTIRLSLRSTVQSVAFACYEGLGVGLGSLFGGWIVHSYGFRTLWLSMAIGSISVGLLNMILELVWSESSEAELAAGGNVEELTEGHKSIIIVLNGKNGHHHSDARREFLQATKEGSIKRLYTPRSFPGPVPLAPFKFQQPAGAKLQMLIRRAKELERSSSGAPAGANGGGLVNKQQQRAPDSSGLSRDINGQQQEPK